MGVITESLNMQRLPGLKLNKTRLIITAQWKIWPIITNIINVLWTFHGVFFIAG